MLSIVNNSHRISLDPTLNTHLVHPWAKVRCLKGPQEDLVLKSVYTQALHSHQVNHRTIVGGGVWGSSPDTFLGHKNMRFTCVFVFMVTDCMVSNFKMMRSYLRFEKLFQMFGNIWICIRLIRRHTLIRDSYNQTKHFIQGLSRIKEDISPEITSCNGGGMGGGGTKMLIHLIQSVTHRQKIPILIGSQKDSLPVDMKP